MLKPLALFAASGIAIAAASPAHAILITFDDGSGLSGEADFTLTNSTTIDIRLKNTSTGGPSGTTAAGYILTGLSFDFNDPMVTITGGSATTGASSSSVNFSVSNVGSGANVGGEWGYGNGGATGLHDIYVSGNTAGATAFGGSNLDGPASLNGPQGGLISVANEGMLGGLGAIKDEINITITLSKAIYDLDFLYDSDAATIEFGSDEHFITNPTPGAATLLGLAGLVGIRRRR